MSQMKLLPDRRFWPLFVTQFLGAFNDNLFKNALVIMIAYRAMSVGGLGPDALVAASAGVFILPFFLFSATAGQLADKISKARLMRWVKAMEIGVMGLAALGFVTGNLVLLLSVLFLMGLQSTFFGPAKYAVLPELLEEHELVGGNALVEMGTFVSILIGTIGGGVLISIEGTGPMILAGAVVTVAVLGWLTSLRIHKTPSGAPDLEVAWDPVRPTLQTFRATRDNRPVFLSILGISWFWFLGATFLTVLPSYGKDLLHGQELVVTFLLSLFCIGIAAGSMACERLSKERLELGLVPFGSIGMSLFALDLFLLGDPQAGLPAPAELFTLAEALRQPGMWRVVLDFSGIAVFSGFYTVPLYTMIQQRSAPEIRSRVIAANNIMNALFMVGSAVMLMGLHAVGATLPQIFGALAVLNAAVALYIYNLIPEFLLRFGAWMLASVLYRLKVKGQQNLPAEGPAVLVANHVSFVDWLLVAAVCKRPVRFVMYHGFLEMPLVGWLFRDAKVIPIAPAHEDAGRLDEAFDRIAAELEDGELVMVFPEGKITKDGRMNSFRSGIERIVSRTPVPVVPLAICGMWGSFFSRKGGRALTRPFARFWSKVSLQIGAPVPAEQANAARLAEAVAELGGFDVPPKAPPAGSGEPDAAVVRG